MINVTSVASIRKSRDKVIRRIHVAPRLRAPLMGRSITTTLNDNANLPKSVSYGSSNGDENEFVNLDKQRDCITLLGERT